MIEISKVVKLSDMKERELLAYADELLETTKENMKQKERFKQIANERIKRINEQLENQTSKLDEWIERAKFELLQIANMTKTKETKAQRKLELLAGDVIIKKATYKFKNDNKKILEAIKKERKDLVKTKTETSLKWAELKKELEIANGKIINKTTGEIVEIEGLEIEEVKEEVVIK